MMDNTVVESRSSNLVAEMPVQIISEERMEAIAKLPVAGGSHQELVSTQYIHLPQVPERLQKLFVNDMLSNELLGHPVDMVTASDFAQHAIAAQYYDADELLTHGLSEDRALDAELVTAQLKQQGQHHTHQISQILGPLSVVQTVNLHDKSQTIPGEIVTGYIQAVDDSVHQQLLNHSDNGERCVMKIYQQSPTTEVQMVTRSSGPLPPLKKVLSSQSVVIRNKFSNAPAVLVELPTTSIMQSRGVGDDDMERKEDCLDKVSAANVQQAGSPCAGQGIQVTGVHSLSVVDDLDSDYDAENDNRPSRRSLPHKKRIPRKLKAPAARNIHTKCYKCNKCGEGFNTQAAFASHRTTHVAGTSGAKRAVTGNLNAAMYNCELCNKQFTTQLQFFEHLKKHYEPGMGMHNNDDVEVSINGGNSADGSTTDCPAPIVATCIAPTLASVEDDDHSNGMMPSPAMNSVVPGGGGSRSSRHAAHVNGALSPSNGHSPMRATQSPIGVFHVVKNELLEQQGLVKEEAVTEMPCHQCGEVFYKSKEFEAHIASHQAAIAEEEFSEPEDMMVDIRHAVNITDVDSGDDQCTPEDDQCSIDIDEDKLRWKYQELGVELQDMVLPLSATQTLPMAQQPSSNIQPQSPENSKLSRALGTGSTEAVLPAKRGGRPSLVENGNKKKSLNCTLCDRTFNHRNSLLYHIRSHSGQRSHQCEVCGKSFFSASALKVHKRLHSGDRPYTCEFCNRNFRQWGDLKYHITSLHSDQKQFQCEYCGKDFARKYSLIVHRRIHTGEKNYRCEYCAKTFRASSYLQNHRRIHTGEKPHSCDICGKPFRVRSDMKRHRQTHSKPRPTGRSSNAPSSPEVITATEAEDEDSGGTETILPDNVVTTPLNLNVRHSGDTDDGITYSRNSMDRENNALYVWIPAPVTNMLSDE